MSEQNLLRVINILADVLQLSESAAKLTEDSLLIGHISELDSMAVVAVIKGIENEFDISIEDDEIGAETFESVQTLYSFIVTKCET